MTRGTRHRQMETRKRILDYRYSQEHFDEYRARREKPIVDKVGIFCQKPAEIGQIQMEHIYVICRVDSKEQIIYICSIRIWPVSAEN